MATKQNYDCIIGFIEDANLIKHGMSRVHSIKMIDKSNGKRTEISIEDFLAAGDSPNEVRSIFGDRASITFENSRVPDFLDFSKRTD